MTRPSPAVPASSTRGIVVRTVLAGLLALLTIVSFLALDKGLRVRIELWTSTSGPVEVYYALSRSGYDARQTIPTWGQVREYWPYEADIVAIYPITEVRFDPLRSPGEFRVRSLQLRNHWHQVTWGPEELPQHLLGTNQVELVHAGPEGLTFASTGTDPYVRFEVPRVLQRRPSWSTVAQPVLGWTIGAMLAWCLLEITALALRHRAPTWHARLRRAFPPLLASTVFTWHAGTTIHGGHVLGDGVQNLMISYNVLRHGTFSHVGGSHPPPTDFREPLPPLVTALHLRVFAPQAKELPFRELRAGALTRTVKLSNLYWVFLGLLATWLFTRRLTHSDVVAPAIATSLAYAFFYHDAHHINTLYTELQTAALLTLTSWALLRGIQAKTWVSFAIGGLSLGLLALTKASFVPIGFVALVMLLVVCWLASARLGVSRWRCLGWMALAGFVAVLTVAPWIARNIVQFDSPRISDRGGLILHGRAVLNNMTDDEVIGLIYENSPSFYRRLVAGTKYGGSPDNRDFMRGGRWQRLNRGLSDFFDSDREAIIKGRPDQAISFHAWAGAHHMRLINELIAQGNPYPEEVVDKMRRREAIEMLAARPWRHLYMTFPFFWHGFWGLPKPKVRIIDFAWQDLVVEMLNLLGGLALIGGMALGLLGRRPALFAATILPFGLMAFYSFISHNIPRYMSPAHPLMMVMLTVAGVVLWRRLARRRASH
jgi:hypothetical protein